LIEARIILHLRAILMEKVKPAHMPDWHEKLVRGGGNNGQPLSARKVGHAHRVCTARSPVQPQLNW
jgi:hypothetical protein